MGIVKHSNNKTIDIFNIDVDKRMVFYAAVNTEFPGDWTYYGAERKFMTLCGAKHLKQSIYSFKSKSKYTEFVLNWL